MAPLYVTRVQRPIGSPFGAETTAQQALAGLDLSGKTAIVTGGYSGLGLETTRALAAAGATVIAPARTITKAEEALAGIAGVELEQIDLLDPRSIDAFGDRFVASGRALHILVNSAGIMAAPLARDARGYESQFVSNHLGHFHLTFKLWPALVKAKGARVVAVTSRAHRISGVNFADPHFRLRAYDKWKAYGQSKTANALFAISLDARGIGLGVRCFSAHPGTIITDLSRHLDDADLAGFGVELKANGTIDVENFLMRGGDAKTAAQGAATTVWCATSALLDGLGGLYCEDCDIAPAVTADDPKPNGVRPWATDPCAAETLWDLSLNLTVRQRMAVAS